MSVPFPQENSLGSSSENVEISKDMSVPEITSILLDHGVRDVTHRLDLGRASNYPVSGGLFSDTYRGALSDGTPVAIKSLRPFIVSGDKQLKVRKNILDLFMPIKVCVEHGKRVTHLVETPTFQCPGATWFRSIQGSVVHGLAVDAERNTAAVYYFQITGRPGWVGALTAMFKE
ncbi:hypothetical protein FRC09_006531 [Ceratobasidium sp. 395]|nr:hypothetical protein FRC09_006531 [Ceratobasidium sp. 395]